jgi:hypothetical protein
MGAHWYRFVLGGVRGKSGMSSVLVKNSVQKTKNDRNVVRESDLALAA